LIFPLSLADKYFYERWWIKWSTMNNINEIYQDIITNCDILLQLLAPYTATNETPEGRMIFQCRWLKEQAQTANLQFPAEFVYSLGHVQAERYLRTVASHPDKYDEEVGIYLYRLLNLGDGYLLLKSTYYKQAANYITALISCIEHAKRSLSGDERNLISELQAIKEKLLAEEITPPLMSWEGYPNFREVYSMTGSTIDDLPSGKYLCKTVAHLIFEGTRPENWTTPEAAQADCDARGY
jgi:hypothetical protein